MTEEKQPYHVPEDISPKKRSLALLLCMLFGWLGLHRFYVDKHSTALLMMLTLGGFGLWYFIDFVWIIAGTFEDKDGKVLHDWY
ncbi:MAG TPA: TM2 domain-containing protein [Thermodesulfovibrionia bacterium]|nr:TM2 domain-containing protein [Thermodesulfovibrionia bacterium]